MNTHEAVSLQMMKAFVHGQDVVCATEVFYFLKFVWFIGYKECSFLFCKACDELISKVSSENQDSR